MMRKKWASLPEEHCLRQPLIDMRGFVEVQFPEEKFKHIVGAEKYTFEHTGEVKRNSLTVPPSLVLQTDMPQCQGIIFLASDFPCRVK